MNRSAYRHSFAADEDARPTMITQLASPCRFIGGCQSVALGTTGRCKAHAHQPSRPVLVETQQRRTKRLVVDMLNIAGRYLRENASVMPGAWS